MSLSLDKSCLSLDVTLKLPFSIHMIKLVRVHPYIFICPVLLKIHCLEVNSKKVSGYYNSCNGSAQPTAFMRGVAAQSTVNTSFY